jgi:hypothetical protein
MFMSVPPNSGPTNIPGLAAGSQAAAGLAAATYSLTPITLASRSGSSRSAAEAPS